MVLVVLALGTAAMLFGSTRVARAGEDRAHALRAALERMENARFTFYEVQAAVKTGVCFSISRKVMTRNKGRVLVDAVFAPIDKSDPLRLPTNRLDPAFWAEVGRRCTRGVPNGRNLIYWNGRRFTTFSVVARGKESKWVGIRDKTAWPVLYRRSFLEGNYSQVGCWLHEVIDSEETRWRSLGSKRVAVMVQPRYPQNSNLLLFSDDTRAVPSECIVLDRVSRNDVLKRWKEAAPRFDAAEWGKRAIWHFWVHRWRKKPTYPRLPEVTELRALQQPRKASSSGPLIRLQQLLAIDWDPPKRTWGVLPPEFKGKEVTVLDELLRTMEVHHADGSIAHKAMAPLDAGPGKPAPRRVHKADGKGSGWFYLWSAGLGLSLLALVILLVRRSGSGRAHPGQSPVRA